MPYTTRLPPLWSGMVPILADANWRSGLWRRRFGLYGMLLFVTAGGVYRGADDRSRRSIWGKKSTCAVENDDRAGDSGHALDAVLLGSALAMMTDAGRSAMLNTGRTVLAVLICRLLCRLNNGSAFAGLSANSPFWNCLLAFCMFVGRFGVIIPVMAIAGSLVSKKCSRPVRERWRPTARYLLDWLIGTVLLVGALTFIHHGAWPGSGTFLFAIASDVNCIDMSRKQLALLRTCFYSYRR